MFERTNYLEPYFLLRYNFFRIVPPCLYFLVLEHKFKSRFNKRLNLNNPNSLSEKVQWLKLYDNSDLKCRLSDKLLLKEYVRNNLPDLKFAQVYQNSKSIDDIDFEKLPERFMIKTNHSWKTCTPIFSKEKLSSENINDIRLYYRQALKINYAYWSYYELQYKNIKPSVYVEEIIGDKYSVAEYEVYCFNGVPKFINYRTRDKNFKKFFGLKQHFYSCSWGKMDFSLGPSVDEPVEIPKNKDFVLSCAQKLSEKFKFVRVDFIEHNDDIYILEMTFTPFSGFFPFSDYSYDIMFGDMLKLS